MESVKESLRDSRYRIDTNRIRGVILDTITDVEMLIEECHRGLLLLGKNED